MIDRERGRDHLDIVAEPGGEQRPNRSVNETRCEGGHLTRAPFPFEKPPRNLAGGVHLLFEVAGQREEVDALPNLRRDGRGHQEHRIPAPDDHRAARLAGERSGFK